MINYKGMDKLLWGKEFEDILDWTKRLQMASEVYRYDEVNLFKITKFNLCGKAKDWFKKLQFAPTDWNEIKTKMQQKFDDVDLDEIKMKMDIVKHEPRYWVQLYFDQLEKLCRKGKIKDVEQRCKFVAHLCPEI